MWDKVRRDLIALLGSEIFPSLLTDKFYRDFLAKAGLGPKLPRSIAEVPQALLPRLKAQAEISGSLACHYLTDCKTLDPATAHISVLRGPAKLYRLYDSKFPEAKIGIWWFTESVMRTCEAEAGRRPEAKVAWLRNFLAICRDWSRCDRIAQLTLGGNDALPQLIAKGLPVREYSLAAGGKAGVSEKDYYRRIDMQFTGGVAQTVLPWIPETLVCGLPHF